MAASTYSIGCYEVAFGFPRINMRGCVPVRQITGQCLQPTRPWHSPRFGSEASMIVQDSPRRSADRHAAGLAVAFLFLCLPSRAMTNYVSIKDSSYIPDQLAIYPGETVTWTQDDNTEHSATSNEQLFSSGGLTPGSSFSFTFDAVGTFPYFCVFH